MLKNKSLILMRHHPVSGMMSLLVMNGYGTRADPTLVPDHLLIYVGRVGIDKFRSDRERSSFVSLAPADKAGTNESERERSAIERFRPWFSRRSHSFALVPARCV
jgi:hypothetical protein